MIIKKGFYKEVIIFLIFCLTVIVSQTLTLTPHLQFGFSPDDVRLISDYISLGPNPFLKFSQAWQAIGPHVVNPLYYDGILFNFFGFNYQGYQIASLIFKILSVISFYILIQTIFKNKLLSFISGLIFSFHYGAAGSLEMVARTQDYLVITGINLFFLLFYLISINKLKHFIWLIVSSIILFCSFFINPIRAFPILPFFLLIELFIFIKNRSWLNAKDIFKKSAVILFPFFLLFFLGEGSSQANPGTILSLYKRSFDGNLQILLTPITTLGSLFLKGDSMKVLSISHWTLSDYFSYMLEGPLIIFGFITILLSKILSKKPIKFFLSVFLTNFVLELVIFLMVNNGLNLPDQTRMHYDISLVPPTILGLYIISITIFVFKEWINKKPDTYLTVYITGVFLAMIFIYSTWLFGDIVYVPLGLNGYSSIPSMGISAGIGSILVLTYSKLRGKNKFFKLIAPVVFIILIPYFSLSNSQVQTFLQRNLDQGMKAADQVYMKNKFWSFVDNPTSCDKFFFLDTKGDYPNGYFYSFILIDRFEKWYNLYGPFHSKKNCPVAFLISDEAALKKSFTNVNGEEGFVYKNTINEEKFFPLKNFYAFKFHDRDIINIKEDILQKIK